MIATMGCGAGERANVGPVEFKETTVAELEKLIADNKGKVVLIDAWFLGCAPCVKKFPNLVDLHVKFAKEGLVCISLNVYPEEIKEKNKVLEFLKKQGADFPNLIFKDDDKKVDDWQEKYDAVSTPAYVLFDRKGERKIISEKAKPQEVEEIVKKLLEAK